MLRQLAFAATIFFAADCASNGRLGSGPHPFCFNAEDNIGCDPRDWFEGNRLDCRQSTHAQMNWAGKTRYTNMYSLVLKDTGKTSYTPGEWITVQLKVNRYPFKYRGLVLHASSSNSNFVGTWRTTGNEDENRMFWMPTANKECIMHAQADLKPLLTEFRFRAPAAGTGTITFKGLIKIGPANDGYFYHPNGANANLYDTIPAGGFPGSGSDLQLSEASAPAQQLWSMSTPGESCDEHCVSLGKTCDAESLQSPILASPAGMESNLSPVTGCPMPYQPSCSSVSPARDSEGVCYYSGADSTFSNICQTSGSVFNLKSTCSAKHPNATRVCACKTSSVMIQSIGEPSLFRGIPILSSSAKSSDKTSSSNHEAHVSTASMGLSVGLFLAFGMMFNLAGGTPLVAAVLAAMASPASAHNWLRSPGRAMTEASTTNPFRQRRITDIHAQLGPGQEMAIKFATGHTRHHYFVVIAGEDEEYIHNNNYKAWVEDYINSAPDSINQASSKPRFHHCKEDSECSDSTYFTGKVDPTDSDFCDHSKYPSGNLYRWKNSLTTTDKYVFYESVKYPWIVGAIRYKQLAHKPKDFDIFCLPVPRRPGKQAHHIVHWNWNAYYDAVDVHAHHSPVLTNLIYGQETGTFEFNKIDHCQFMQPGGLTTPIRTATHNVSDCLETLQIAAAAFPTQRQTMGLNVVPLVNPAGTLASGVRNIPLTWTSDPDVDGLRWPKDYVSLALNSPEMRHTGVESSSTLNWNMFLTRSQQIKDGKRCNGRQNYNSFAEAISECLATNCWAIAWEYKSQEITQLSKGSQRVRVCQASDTSEVADDAWELYYSPATPSTNPEGWTNPAGWNDNNHPVYKISFQPSDPRTKTGSPFTITLPAGWKVDSGAAFGNRGGGLKYGWKCPFPMAVELNKPRLVTSSTDYATGKAQRWGWADKCSGESNNWEIEVPNGVYVVTMYTGNHDGVFSGAGCVMENTRFIRVRNDEKWTTKIITVEVTDGRLTISSVGTKVRGRGDPFSLSKPMYCPDLHWIKIDRLMDALPKAWVPTAPKAWWQLGLHEPSAGVGVVSIELPGSIQFSPGRYPKQSFSYNQRCSQWWFFSASEPRCYHQRNIISREQMVSLPDLYKDTLGVPNPSNTFIYDESAMPWGTFTGGEDGVVVSVSNVACTDSTCKASDENVCEIATHVQNCEQSDGNHGIHICPLLFDCKGKTGNYLRVRMRGSNRFLAVRKITVHRSEPKAAALAASAPEGKKPMVCYGVEARIPATTTPEYLTTDDTKDPIFYSSCYLSSKVIQWLPIDGPTETTRSRWAYNGDCLSCESYAVNKNGTFQQTPQWYLSNTCQNCFGQLPVWGESDLTGPSQAPTPFPTVYPTSPVPTASPSTTNTQNPTPGSTPTPYPTELPTAHPSPTPTKNPTTGYPSTHPIPSTNYPTPATTRPTKDPTSFPPTPAPTPSPTRVPSKAPLPSRAPTREPTRQRRRWRVRLTLLTTMGEITPQFRRRFKIRLANFLNIAESAFKVEFYSGSVIADVVFSEDNADDATSLSEAPTQSLTNIFTVDVTVVSAPIPVEDEEKDSSSTDIDIGMVGTITASLVAVAIGFAIVYYCMCRRKYSPPVISERNRRIHELQDMKITVEGEDSSFEPVGRLNLTAGDVSDFDTLQVSPRATRAGSASDSPASSASAASVDERRQMWKKSDAEWNKYKASAKWEKKWEKPKTIV